MNSEDFVRKHCLKRPTPHCGRRRRTYRRYAKNANWDHDHCSFCWTEFAVEERPDVLHEGYCTLNEYHWICADCFEDFKERFDWRVVAVERADA